MLVVKDQNIRLTYSEMKKRVDSLAKGFLKLNLQPGDAVGIYMPNNSEWLISKFAIIKAGLVSQEKRTKLK